MKAISVVIPLTQLYYCFHFATGQCYDAYQCAGESINLTTTSIINQTSVECYGDHSCFDAISIANADANIECYGSFSCANATNVILDSLDTYYYDSISCDGLYSCAYISNLFNFDDNMYCDGELSCFGSILGANDNLYCNGDRSCANTHITIDDNPNSVQFSGYLSAQNALLYDDKDSVPYYFRGANSGDGAQIICANGVTCDVYCYGNACSNIKSIECDGSCTIAKDCVAAEKSDICPDGYELASFIDYTLPIPETYNGRASSIDNSQNLCQEPTKTFINCEDYQECSYSEDLESTESNTGAICCSSYQGCYGADSIRTTLNLSIVNADDVAIRCDGFSSCATSSLIYAQNGGNIYLSGFWAAGLVTLEANMNYDIFCSGDSACTHAIIESCDNLYCTGSYSCFGCFIIQFVNNIWAYGEGALFGSVVKDVYDSIYCGGYQSCIYVNIYNVTGDVYGHSYQVLYSSTIENVNGSVYGIGTEALQGAHIRNVKNVCSICK